MSRQQLRLRPRKPVVAASHVKVIPIEQMQRIRDELERAQDAGPVEQMKVVNWAAQFADCYFRTRDGQLRRVFPSAKVLERQVKRREHGTASGEPEADVHRAQQ